ncbi:nucleotide exchange factor GrpE [Candidatus Peribacteria bacterium]|nr:nucleotide exchange factor GrpE [Candidatus Peribacteria bacterium]
MSKPDPAQDDDLTAKVAAAAASAAAKDVDVVGFEKKIAELTEQLKKAQEVASRAQAELQNAKARLEREAGDLRKFASEAVLLRLLPTIDNLQRALKHLPKDLEKNEWVKGIVALEQEFLKQVGDMGLKRFESMGQPIDAERHEVLMQVAGEESAVVEVLEDGYELHGKVVRPAKVKAGGG